MSTVPNHNPNVLVERCWLGFRLRLLRHTLPLARDKFVMHPSSSRFFQPDIFCIQPAYVAHGLTRQLRMNFVRTLKKPGLCTHWISQHVVAFFKILRWLIHPVVSIAFIPLTMLCIHYIAEPIAKLHPPVSFTCLLCVPNSARNVPGGFPHVRAFAGGAEA